MVDGRWGGSAYWCLHLFHISVDESLTCSIRTQALIRPLTAHWSLVNTVNIWVWETDLSLPTAHTAYRWSLVSVSYQFSHIWIRLCRLFTVLLFLCSRFRFDWSSAVCHPFCPFVSFHYTLKCGGASMILILTTATEASSFLGVTLWLCVISLTVTHLLLVWS